MVAKPQVVGATCLRALRMWAAQWGLLAILFSALMSSPTVSLAVHGLGEAVIFSGKDDDIGVVGQAVNQGDSQTVITKGIISLTELKI